MDIKMSRKDINGHRTGVGVGVGGPMSLNGSAHYPMTNGNGAYREVPSMTTSSNSHLNVHTYHSHASANGSSSIPPDDEELERRLNDILKSMDLPPDKAKILRNYDSKKKWELICDQERVTVKEPPSVYLCKLRQLIEPKLLSSKTKSLTLLSKNKSKNGSTSGSSSNTSTQTLRNLETSLRTNSIEWVREFLNEDNCGLDVLIDYLASRLQHIKDDSQSLANHSSSMQSLDSSGTSSNGHCSTRASISSTSTGVEKEKERDKGFGGLGGLQHKSLRLSRSSAQKRLGQPQDDVHVCILCLRAIMNNKFGFNMVISRADAINYIALSLVHRSLRTKALVLELLAAICLVKGGHEMILAAFDNFKQVHGERRRFQTLMYYFRNYEDFNIDFMVACMQFINILVHSVECMNYRVFLQYEFTIIGLDDYLEKLKHHESEELTTQIAAYLDNVFDVTALMRDAELSHAALERVTELEEHLTHAQERIKSTEHAALGKIANLENRLTDLARERDDLRMTAEQTGQELNTLRRTMTQREEETNRILSAKTGTSSNGELRFPAPFESGPRSGPAPPPPPPPPLIGAAVFPNAKKSSAPIPPPPVPSGLAWRDTGHAPPPPPAPGMGEAPSGALTIKRKVNTKHKLPVLNWVVLKPNQVKGTIFNELDDEKILNSMDFSSFEEQFKTSNAPINRNSAVMQGGDYEVDGGKRMNGEVRGMDQDLGEHSPSKNRFKRVEKLSLLEANRLRNLAIMRRNIELSTQEVVDALNGLDVLVLNQDYVEVLLRILPGEEETKKYRDYARDGKPSDVLTDEDRFLLQLVVGVERLAGKLQMLNLFNTFQASLQTLTPQLQAIFAASRAVRKSDKFRRILELVLAFGNYLNSSRRGPAYGFKLQSLEALLDLKSHDKKTTLLHFIAQTVEEKYTNLIDFDSELIFIDKAAEVSLENVVTDLHELEKGMELCRRECDLRKPSPPPVLRDFMQENESRLSQLQKEQRVAVEAFGDVAEYFGESPRTTQPKDFFTSILRFAKAFRAALEENALKRALLMQQQTSPNGQGNLVRVRTKKSQDAVMSELKNKAPNIKEKKLLPPEEVYHGALEDILLGLKNEPYRRADALRRSQRRKDGATLSQVMGEMDL